ncbi:MAG: hypothetical protein JWN29_489 [Acidimicrobiales bacterium]|nr:hypothetical protein [Acidimicrobiales bacterium]
MADERTSVTEIVTGLGMTGASSLESALAARPSSTRGAAGPTWSTVTAAHLEGRHGALFEAAWRNGRAFLEASDGLRGRSPLLVEWKGPHKPPGYDSLPADLRVDHVFLVSCKYGSDISTNCSPSNLFDRLLSERTSRSEPWYEDVAPVAYAAFYAEVRTVIDDLPPGPGALAAVDIERIRLACKRTWPVGLVEPWRAFSAEVATATAHRWQANLDTLAKRELQLWRLLRLETSPYFVLGTKKTGAHVRYRVATPWDWRQAYRLRSLDITAAAAGQPLVRWRAVVEDRAAGHDVGVEGEIEVRWSHGRFSAVEAKLNLTTPPEAVPGYVPLT